jgi:signal transduction histidine kinase
MGHRGLSLLDTQTFSRLAGADWAKIWPRREQAKAREALGAARAGMSVSLQATCALSLLGGRRWSVAISPIRDADRLPGEPCRLLAVWRDTTPLAAAADSGPAHQLEALGKLTARVAHDLNNMLAVIIGAAETLEQDGSPEQRRLAGASLRAAERAAETVRRLMAVAEAPKAAGVPAEAARVLEAPPARDRLTVGREPSGARP